MLNLGTSQDGLPPTRASDLLSAVDFDLLGAARAALATWQPRLRLGDWDIWLVVGEVADPHYAAQSDKEWRTRRAHITFPPDFCARVHREAEVLPGETDTRLVEHTLIHELLHILEEPLAARVTDEITWLVGDRDGGGVLGAELRNSWRDYREWWINHTVRALLEAYAGR